MNITELRELLELIAERNISEFELEEEGMKLRIRKGGDSTALTAQVVPLAADAPTAASAGQPAEANPPADPEAALDGLAIVSAPMVGTFYRQAEPGAEPFARPGDRITKGQILCIIEAMKLMNEIESELSGELVQVFVEDGQAVQYGDRLFAIREM